MNSVNNYLQSFGNNSLSYLSLQPLCSNYVTDNGVIAYVDKEKSIFKKEKYDGCFR